MLYLDNEGNTIDPPKYKTMAAIRRKYGNGITWVEPKDKDWQAMKAIQYMLAMKGIDTPFQFERNYSSKYVKFDKNRLGERRAVSVKYKSYKMDIPNWDWVPHYEDLSF